MEVEVTICWLLLFSSYLKLRYLLLLCTLKGYNHCEQYLLCFLHYHAAEQIFLDSFWKEKTQGAMKTIGNFYSL